MKQVSAIHTAGRVYSHFGSADNTAGHSQITSSPVRNGTEEQSIEKTIAPPPLLWLSEMAKSAVDGMNAVNTVRNLSVSF